MKTIIKRGTKEVTTCKNCGCVFSYEPEDMLEKALDNYKAYMNMTYTICPQCESEVVLMQTK